MTGAAATAAVGLMLGVLLQRSRYCTMGALSDLFLFGSRRRLRILAVAVATALLGTQALVASGLLQIDDRLLFLAGRADPAMALLGGLCFGFGMVQAGGCVSRSLVRASEGDARALLALALALATAAIVARSGLPTSANRAAGVPFLDEARLGLGPLPATLISLAAAAALALWALPERSRAHGRETLTGVALGALATLAWIATSRGAGGGAAAGLDLVAAALPASTLPGDRLPLAGGLPLLLGTSAGALASALWARAWRVTSFRDPADLARHGLGGLLMGVGGGLGLGCTLGHGLAGLSLLAPISIVGVAGMALGARWALHHLETGRLRPW